MNLKDVSKLERISMSANKERRNPIDCMYVFLIISVFMLNLTLVGMICGIRYSGKEFSNRNRQLQTICNEHKELIYKGTPFN